MTWLVLSVAIAVLATAVGLAIPLRRLRRRRAAAEVVLLAVEDEATRGVEWDLYRSGSADLLGR